MKRQNVEKMSEEISELYETPVFETIYDKQQKFVAKSSIIQMHIDNMKTMTKLAKINYLGGILVEYINYLTLHKMPENKNPENKEYWDKFKEFNWADEIFFNTIRNNADNSIFDNIDTNIEEYNKYGNSNKQELAEIMIDKVNGIKKHVLNNEIDTYVVSALKDYSVAEMLWADYL